MANKIETSSVHETRMASNETARIGIDLGTANLLVYVESLGVIFNEPSVIAIERETNRVVAVGEMAARMLGRGHDKIKVVKPLNQGVISDMDAAKKLLEHAFNKLEEYNADLKKSTVLITCPSEVTQVERESMLDLAYGLGVKDIFIEEEVKAGAIGAGLDIFSANGVMVIDMGGGSTDIGVLALGDIVVSESIRIAGNYLDNEIVKLCQFKHSLLIGEKTAERVKIEIGSVKEDLTPAEAAEVSEVKGRDLITGLPKKVDLTKAEIAAIFIPAFEEVANSVLKLLQVTPPELCADIIVHGIVLNGGGALVEGVTEFYKKRVDLDIIPAENALTAIVEGTRTLLQNRGNYLVKPVD